MTDDQNNVDAPRATAPEPIVTLRREPVPASSSAHGTGGGHKGGRKGGRRRAKWYRAPLLFLASAAFVCALIYGAGVFAFSSICYPGTTIAGIDVSLMARSTAVSRISSAVVNYRLTVTYGDFEWVYSPESTDDILDAGTAFDRVVDANEPLRWPVRLYESLVQGTSTVELELPASFDTEAFCAEVAEAVAEYNADRSGTFDKQSAYDEELGMFTVEAARANQLLDADAVAEVALAALASLTRSVELDESCTVEIAGGATDEELQEICDAANAIIASSITLTLDGTVIAELSGTDILEWIELDEDYQLGLDSEAAGQWAEDLAEDVNTVGTRRSYTRADGEQVAVKGGTWGWEIDEDALVEELTAAIAAGGAETIEVPCSQEGDVYAGSGEPDWESYIDVDISEQYARYYDADGSIIWEAGVITGNTTKGYDTPTGVYYLVSKATDVTLLGELLDDGSYSYESHVTYWMPFIGGSIGFHDATWQNEDNFGVPGANTWTGSHGCVNLSYSAAAELYSIIEVGVCVIVHD